MIKEIRERLSKITKGDWHFEYNLTAKGQPLGITLFERGKYKKAIMVCGNNLQDRIEDWSFAAHAAKDIEYLLNEVDRLNEIINFRKHYHENV